MRVGLHPEALAELELASQFYESRSSELRIRFIEAVEEATARILQSPGTWRLIDDDVRRCLTHVFPFGVLYVLESESVLIVAITNHPPQTRHRKNRQ
jgi:toxin ParE1/3/4